MEGGDPMNGPYMMISPEILGMSDRIAVMHGGTIAGILDRAAATQESILERALGHVAEAGVLS